MQEAIDHLEHRHGIGRHDTGSTRNWCFFNIATGVPAHHLPGLLKEHWIRRQPSPTHDLILKGIVLGFV